MGVYPTIQGKGLGKAEYPLIAGKLEAGEVLPYI